MNFKRPFCGPNVRYWAIEDIGLWSSTLGSGGLISYAPDSIDSHQRAAGYVDRIQ
jgi:hypothetical protein